MATVDQSSKAALRTQLLAARRALGDAAMDAAATAVTGRLLALPELTSARCVAAYLSFGTEPRTSAVLSALSSRGVRVLLPVLRPDRDLDWAIYDDPGTPRDSDARLRTTSGLPLGSGAVSEAEVIVVPALAVGTDGTRLGRGGGSYDRALARVSPDRPVVALLYEGELLESVPAEPHDRRVTIAVLPSGVHRFPQTARTARPAPT